MTSIRLDNAQPILANDPKDGIELKLSFADCCLAVIYDRNPDTFTQMEKMEKLADGYNYLKHRRFWRAK